MKLLITGFDKNIFRGKFIFQIKSAEQASESLSDRKSNEMNAILDSKETANESADQAINQIIDNLVNDKYSAGKIPEADQRNLAKALSKDGKDYVLELKDRFSSSNAQEQIAIQKILESTPFKIIDTADYISAKLPDKIATNIANFLSKTDNYTKILDEYSRTGSISTDTISVLVANDNEYGISAQMVVAVKNHLQTIMPIKEKNYKRIDSEYRNVKY